MAAIAVFRTRYHIEANLGQLQSTVFSMHAARRDLVQQLRERVLTQRFIGDSDTDIVDAALRYFDVITDEQTSF